MILGQFRLELLDLCLGFIVLTICCRIVRFRFYDFRIVYVIIVQVQVVMNCYRSFIELLGLGFDELLQNCLGLGVGFDDSLGLGFDFMI